MRLSHWKFIVIGTSMTLSCKTASLKQNNRADNLDKEKINQSSNPVTISVDDVQIVDTFAPELDNLPALEDPSFIAPTDPKDEEGGFNLADTSEPQEKATTTIYVAGTSVGDHSACGASSIPNTYKDVNDFLNKKPTAAGLTSNYWYNNRSVNSRLFASASDNVADSYTKSRRRGVDASTIHYHSSHGYQNDSSRVFTTWMGSNSPSCTISSNQMSIGNSSGGNLRYLFLSTCFSLKLGNGSGASITSANKEIVKTWATANAGTRCVFGFSTVSLDVSYGAPFWTEWNKAGMSNSMAWLNAVAKASPGKVGVVTCAGPNSTEATNRLNEQYFYTGWVNDAYYSWRYNSYTRSATPPPSSSFALTKAADGPIPTTIKIGSDSNLQLTSTTGSAGAKTGMPLSSEPQGKDLAKSPDTISISDDAAIALATQKQRSVDPQGTFVVADVMSIKEGNSQDRAERVVSKVVSLRRSVNGAPILDSNLTKYVSFGGNGQISEETGRLPTVVVQGNKTVDFSADTTKLKDRAKVAILAKAKEKIKSMGLDPAQVILSISSLEMGYRAADANSNGEIPLGFHATIEPTTKENNALKAFGVSVFLQ